MRKIHAKQAESQTPKYEKREKKNNGKWINVILVLCLVAMVFCGYQIYAIYEEQARGNELNKQMEVYVEYTPVDTQGQTETEGSPLIVDFAALQQKNSEICGWILFEDSVINYPVVRGSDNDYYLTHTSSKDKNNCGAIFMDYHNSADFMDSKTIIYGHRMNNGTMFASLLEYRSQEYYEQHPYGLLATPEKTYVLQVFAAKEIEDDLDNYRTSFTSLEDFCQDIQMLSEDSFIETGVEVQKEDHVVMLSTCVKGDHGKRFVVLARLVDYESYVF